METHQQHPHQDTRPPGRGSIFRNVLIPVASIEDAEETCLAVLPTLVETGGALTALHIIDTNGGWPDMAPREYRRYIANDALELVRREASARGIRVATRVIFESEITRAIIAMADEINASAIVFTPRGSGRWRSLFSSGVAFSLIKQSTRPVIVFPAVGGT